MFKAQEIHGGFERVKVCWLGTESDSKVGLRGRWREPPTALILGRMEPGRDKGHQTLIDCWPRVVASVPDARLLVVGNGRDYLRLRARAARSVASASIEFAGYVPDEEIDAIWARAWVLAMPSRGEGFGLVYAEAMRQGIPIVASIHDAASEISIDNETGYNVDLDREDELPDRLISLLGDSDLAARLGINGQQRWACYFSFGAFERRFRPLLEHLLDH